MMGTGIYVDNVEKEVKSLQSRIDNNTTSQLRSFLLISFVLLVVSIFVTFFGIRKNITKPLNDLIFGADNLSSGDGDLTRKLEVVGNDEIALASQNINRFIEKVRILISEVKGLSSENFSISHQLSSTSQEVGRSVETSMKIVGNTTQ